MNREFSLPIWASRFCGNEKNARYPDMLTVTNAEEFKAAVKNDHTFICFKNNYRSEENFEYACALTEDIDNTHSENPDDWYTKEDIIAAFPDVQMIIYTSRNNMKKKDGRAARPRFHIVFFVDRIDNPADYKLLLQMVRDYFPYFDAKAQDAARFFYGNPDTEIYVQPGVINLSAFFDLDEFARMEKEIREGSRNDTLFRWAVSSMKRYGDTEETIKRFHMMADRCNPPLPDEELQSILKSASRYEKNGDLRPEHVMTGSGKKVWWKCPDGHSWRAAVYSRKNNGCPICSGRQAVPGVNDLKTMMPEVASQWDYEKNGDLLPEKVAAQSNRIIWWRCEKGHSWKAKPCERFAGNGCPRCNGRIKMVTHFMS